MPFFRKCRSEIFLFTKEEVPFVNLVLQGGVPMPQTPFLGVLGLSYVQQSCLEGHAGPKSASKGKPAILKSGPFFARLKGQSRGGV